MHIENNVFDNVLGTLINLDGKTKDNENSRKDLMEMGISHELYLKPQQKGAQAKRELSRKTKAIGGSEPVDHEVEAEIARDVIQKHRPRGVTGHGAGVKKSQVTKFGIEYRRMRGEAISSEKQFLLDKVDCQSKKIKAQSKLIELLSKKNEAQSKKLESQSKKLKSQSKQIESLSKNNESQSKQIESLNNRCCASLTMDPCNCIKPDGMLLIFTKVIENLLIVVAKSSSELEVGAVGAAEVATKKLQKWETAQVRY
ncbi:hypothetical protein Tco_1549342 [Tanacetum coccineum]